MELVVSLAFVIMYVLNILEVMWTQAAARNRAYLTGALSTLWWLANMMTTFITVTALDGHNDTYKLILVGVISVANFIGTAHGVKIGKRFISDAALYLSRRLQLGDTHGA